MKKLQLPTQNGFQFVNPLDIIFLKANNNYTEIFITNESNKILICRTLKKIEQCLPNELFFRCHRAYIVNIKQIAEFKCLNGRGGEITLKDKQKVKLSRRNKKIFLEIIKKHTLLPFTK